MRKIGSLADSRQRPATDALNTGDGPDHQHRR
jgi:hypothetical protein